MSIEITLLEKSMVKLAVGKILIDKKKNATVY
jgi:hypothetical protein